MRFSTVQALFRRRHPEGSIVKLRNHKVRVRFMPEGKAYEYRVRSNPELAERLELIPHDDTATVAKRVLEQFLDGKVSAIDQSGAGDTVRWYWFNEHGKEGHIDEEPFSKDEYGRTVSMYSMSTDPDPWSSWVTQDDEEEADAEGE